MSPERLSPTNHSVELTNARLKEINVKKTVGLALDKLDNIIRPMIPKYPEEFSTVFREAVKDKNVIPVIISSHQGHADLLSIAIVSKQLSEMINETRYSEGNKSERKFEGFLLPIAGSLRTGDQGILLKEFITQLEDRGILDQYSLSLADYVRPKDQTKYGLETGNGLFLRKLLLQIRAGNGIALPPEASVESGRMGADGKRKGMQRFDCVNIDTILRSMELNDKTALFIPIGSHGSFNIVSPDNNQLTPQAWSAFFSKVNTRSLMDIKVGMPIRQTEIITSLQNQNKPVTFETIGDFFGGKVAELLPPDVRGYYAK